MPTLTSGALSCSDVSSKADPLSETPMSGEDSSVQNPTSPASEGATSAVNVTPRLSQVMTTVTATVVTTSLVTVPCSQAQ